jgi:hypothetical protein
VYRSDELLGIKTVDALKSLPALLLNSVIIVLGGCLFSVLEEVGRGSLHVWSIGLAFGAHAWRLVWSTGLEQRLGIWLGHVDDVQEHRYALYWLPALFATDQDAALKDADLGWKRRDIKVYGLAWCHVVVSAFHAH